MDSYFSLVQEAVLICRDVGISINHRDERWVQVFQDTISENMRILGTSLGQQDLAKVPPIDTFTPFPDRLLNRNQLLHHRRTGIQMKMTREAGFPQSCWPRPRHLLV
jgi:hypothetical protein